MAIINNVKQRFDGFLNAISGVGTSRDVGMSSTFKPGGRVNFRVYNAVYAESALFARIIDILPEEGLSKWIDYNHDSKEQIDDVINALGLIKALERAGKKERLHGGSVVYCDVDDGQTHDMPLNLDRVRSFNAVTVFEGEYVNPVNPDRSGYAEMYELTGSAMMMRIHRSRLLVFPGIEVADDCFHDYPGMCRESISRRIMQAVKRYEMILNNMGALSAKMLVGVWKMEGLNELINNDQDEDIKGRLEAQRRGVSLINDVVIDALDSYELLTPNLTGLKDILEPAVHNLVAVSGIPHTKLLGETPGASLGATGGGQERDFNKTVASYQESCLYDNVQKALDMITAALGVEPVSFEFNPIDAPDLKTMADTRKAMAETDQKYIDMGVLLPEEVRQSRFEGGFSVETELDDVAYMQELALDRVADEQTTETDVS